MRRRVHFGDFATLKLISRIQSRRRRRTPDDSPPSILTRPSPSSSVLAPVHISSSTSLHSLHPHSNPSHSLGTTNRLRRVSFISHLAILRFNLETNPDSGRFRFVKDPQRKHHLPPIPRSSSSTFKATRRLLPRTLIVFSR